MIPVEPLDATGDRIRQATSHRILSCRGRFVSPRLPLSELRRTGEDEQLNAVLPTARHRKSLLILAVWNPNSVDSVHHKDILLLI
jgi:hypothetical protein